MHLYDFGSFFADRTKKLEQKSGFKVIFKVASHSNSLKTDFGQGISGTHCTQKNNNKPIQVHFYLCIKCFEGKNTLLECIDHSF